LKFGKLSQNLADLKFTGRTCLRQLVTNFFANQTKICPVRPGPKADHTDQEVIISEKLKLLKISSLKAEQKQRE